MITKNSMKKIVAALLLCNQMLSPVLVLAENSTSDDQQAVEKTETPTTESTGTDQSANEEVIVFDEAEDLSESTKKDENKETTESKVTRDYSELDVAKVTVTAIPRGNTGTDRTKERRNMEHSSLETTGIFLPRGEEIKIVLDEEPENLTVVIGQYGYYGSLDTDEEYPEDGMGWAISPKSYSLVKGENIISRPDSDGMVYIENKSNTQTLSISLEGGVDVPRYVLGEEGSVEKFIATAEKLKDKVPFFEIEGKYVFGTFQMSQLEYLNYEDKNRLPELLAYWDQVVIWTNEAYGFSSEAGYAAEKNLKQRIHITNPDIALGYAAATSKRIIFQINTGASKHILSGLPTDDQWGLWHEIGHTYQTPYYTFEEMGEVTVNISANYIRYQLGMGDRTESKKNDVLKYLNLPRNEKNYIEQDAFTKLASLWTLQRVFGDDFFPTLSQEYRTTPVSELPSGDSEERIQNMIQMMSKVVDRNLIPYFDMWGLDASEETKKICNQFPDLEKDIWLDISGFDDRYELPGVLPDYTIPTGKEVNASIPIFSKDFSIDGLKSVPSDSKVTIDAPQYSDIGVGKTASVKVTNENRVSNIIPITGEITGGDAVKFRGNTSAYRIIAPDAKTKKFSVIGNGSNLHSGWNGSEYASIVHYNASLNTIKNQVTLNGSGESSNSALMQEAFDGQSYEVGDYVRIHHVESNVRLDRYQKDVLLDADNEKTYWYVMTKDGWKETSLDLDVVVKGGNFTLGQKVTPEELIELPKESNLEVESISFKTAPNMSEVGETTAEVLIKTTLGVEQVVLVDNIKVTGGDAVKFRGNTSAYRIISPDAATKTFSVTGSGYSFHGTGWNGSEYASIVQYDATMKTIKNQVTVNGSYEGSDSALMQEAFDGQSYEVGDYVRIHHVESNVRLDRYQKDELLEKDSEKIYWYKMTEDGWKQVDISPTVLPVSNASITMAAPLRADELVEVTPFGDLTIEKIEVEKEPSYGNPGEIEVPIKVTDSLGQTVSVKVPVTVTGGDAVKFYGNYANAAYYQMIAPDAKSRTFSVRGNATNLHSNEPGKLVSIRQFDHTLKTIKQEVAVNGSGDGSNSQMIQEAFNGQTYEVGDYVEIYHKNSQSQLDRYQKDELLKKDSEKTYWYVMTKDGWKETSLDLDVVVKGGNFTLGQKVTPEELIELPKESNLEVESISFKTAPNMSEVGETTAEVLIKTTLGVEQVVLVDNIKVTGGDAVKFRGNTSAYRIISPDAATKTFSVTGSGYSFHGTGWNGSEYASIVQYDATMKTIKNQVTVNGSYEGSDSALMQEAFDGQSYEVGDYVRIHHVESNVRLDRYQKDELLEKDSEKIYWYKMTEDGWKQVNISPTVLPVSNASITMGAPIRAAELVEVTPYGELTIETIEVEKEPKYADPGEIEVPVKATDSMGQTVTITVPVTVTGGNAVKFFGNTSAYRIIAPDAKTKKFSVIGNGSNLHSGWNGSEYASIVHYNASLNMIKNQVTLNGSGESSNSNLMQEAFDGQSYAVGDYVKIYHIESHTRLDRYLNDELQEKDREQVYWYEMTASGWVPLAGEPEEGSVSVDGYQYGDINLTGTFSGDIKRGRLTINQQVVSWGGTFRDGQFTYYIGAGRIKEGDHAVIDFLNSEDEVVESYEIHPTSPSGKVEPATYMLGSSEIKTTFEGDVKRARLVVDNVVVSVGGTISEGNVLKYYVNPAQIKQDSKVVLQGYNSADQPVGEPAAVEVLAFDGQLTTAEYVMNGQWIKGSYEGSVKKAQLSIDGRVISSGGTFKTDGSFEYYVNPTQIKADSEVYLTPYDGSGKLMEERTYPVTLS
ncbi:immunoglobulin-like domain-containing protein [Enterococcus rotai]|uniref:immunoglobulin-like domain-containing protein n=1 Tax=Enterococcus rotai TaxID=118060 RepID=UPI0032B58507